jgi:hypothetical protein
MRPTHADLLESWLYRWPGQISRWAWAWLAAAGAKGDPAARAVVVRTARSWGRWADHDRRAAARVLVVSWWVADRDPELREAVLSERLLAGSDADRWVISALHNQLLSSWEPDAAPAMPGLLTDADPAVRHAEAACTGAAEPILGKLWRAVDPATPGLDALIRNKIAPSPGDARDRTGAAEVLDPISVLAGRPLSQTTAAGLVLVESAGTRPGEPRGALLRACLRHRHGDDIALGSDRAAAAPHDIALVVNDHAP